MLVDLHTHSRVSDGTEQPRELVSAAAAAGLDVVALTDHDTTAGWAEAEAAARAVGIRLVPGMEVSCRSGAVSVHILSYLHDPQHPGLRAEVDRTRASRLTRAERIVELLGPSVGLTWEHVLAQVADGATVGRPHIADALVARGVVRDREEAFAGLLSSHGPNYVRHYAPQALDVVRLIVEAGGVPVMAHPLARLRGHVVDDATVEELVEAGLAGLEVRHRDNSPPDQQHLSALAERLGLLVTGSSDYHGAGKPNRLAENTTDPQVLAEIQARATGTAVVG